MTRRGNWAILCLAMAAIIAWLGFDGVERAGDRNQPELVTAQLYQNQPRLGAAEQYRDDTERPREDPPDDTGGSAGVLAGNQQVSSQLPPVPPGGKIVDFESQTKDGLRETVVKLESDLLPVELAAFYVDELVDDWMIYRDTLSGNIGWSGVYLQMGEVERRMGIFATSQEWNDLRSQPVMTRISISLVEEI